MLRWRLMRGLLENVSHDLRHSHGPLYPVREMQSNVSSQKLPESLVSSSREYLT